MLLHSSRAFCEVECVLRPVNVSRNRHLWCLPLFTSSDVDAQDQQTSLFRDAKVAELK